MTHTRTRQLKTLTLLLYRHRAVRYLFVGATTFVLDLSLLILLHGLLHINLAVATSIAYWVAICYNFMLNRWWTFSAAEKNSLSKHLPPYLLLLGFNYIFTVLFVGFASREVPYEVAKIIAVPIQMIWTYPLYKTIFSKSPELTAHHAHNDLGR